MYFSITSTLAASLLLALASAQTYSDCNPMLKPVGTCPANPALAGTQEWNYNGLEPCGFKYLSGKDMIKWNVPDGAIFRVAKSKDSPTIVSTHYIMWGKFEVTMKAAPGAGIVSSIVLQSEDLDEIDWEWLGGKPGEAQSNYFGKGNTESYDRGAVHSVDSQAQYHTYGMDWTAEKLDWTIDGTVVRTLTPAMVKGDFYPQTPMAARLGIWAGGDPDNEQGVITWSGGPTNYKAGPFDMLVKRIFIQDYSTGSQYVYGDRSGSAKSIKAVGGKVAAGPQSGSGNLQCTGSSSSSGAKPTGSSSYNAPSNSGRVVSSTTKSEATSTSRSGSNADSAESAHNSASPSSPSPSPSGANGAAYFATGGSSGTTEAFTGAASTLAVATAGMAVAAAGLIVGWIL